MMLLYEAETMLQKIEVFDYNPYMLESEDSQAKENAEKNESSIRKVFQKIKEAFIAIARKCAEFIKSVFHIQKSEKAKRKEEIDDLKKSYEEVKKVAPNIGKSEIEILDVKEFKNRQKKAMDELKRVSEKKDATESDMEKAQRLFNEALEQDPPTRKATLDEAFKFATEGCDAEIQESLTSLAMLQRDVEKIAGSMDDVAKGVVGAVAGSVTEQVKKRVDDQVRCASYAAINKNGSIRAYQRELRTYKKFGGKAMSDVKHYFGDLGRVIASGGTDEYSKAMLKANRLRNDIGNVSKKKRAFNEEYARRLEQAATRGRILNKVTDPSYNGVDKAVNTATNEIAKKINSKSFGKRISSIGREIDKYF